MLLCLAVVYSLDGIVFSVVSIFIAYMVRNVLYVIIFKKVLHLDMKTFIKETYVKITPALLVVLGFGLCLENFNPMDSGFLRFVINGGVFVIAFAVVMLFVMNKSEKDMIFGTVNKVLRKLKLVK